MLHPFFVNEQRIHVVRQDSYCLGALVRALFLPVSPSRPCRVTPESHLVTALYARISMAWHQHNQGTHADVADCSRA
jgi:hypothetical protein